MRVRDLDLQPVVTIRQDVTLSEAAETMRYNNVGSLAVMEGHDLRAILTERDLLRAAADRVDPASTSLRFYASEEPVTIRADADLSQAGSLMLATGIRHLPVVDDDKLIGMISVRDLFMVMLAQAESSG